MRRRSHRHPALETAVFAAALLLSVFIARELWLRRFLATPAPAEPAGPVALNPTRLPLPSNPAAHRTETAVNSAAPIKLQRPRSRRRLSEAVPPPR